MAQKGDLVRFLNSVGGGIVVRTDSRMVYVEDEDGFEVPALDKECVVVAPAGSAEALKAAQKNAVPATKAAKPKDSAAPTATSAAPQPSKIVAHDTEIEIEETDHGDSLNVALAFEPTDVKNLTQASFDCLLVNDSNYYLQFVFATQADPQSPWSLRRTGLIEPNIILTLGEFLPGDFAGISRINVQLLAFKEDKDFTLKRPVSVIHKLDATHFFKIHCFKSTSYFENPVIQFDIVNDDAPFRSTKIDPSGIENAMRRRNVSDRRPIVHRPEQRRHGEAIVVDLHIEELVDSTRGLSPADMLNLQVDEFRRVMDGNANNKGQKIIFIHGKGEGVLRQALMKELNYRYKQHQVEDAPFRDFGTGATMVIIH